MGIKEEVKEFAKKEMEGDREYFGEELGMYRKMLWLGAVLFLAGLGMSVSGYAVPSLYLVALVGIVLLFIGGMLALTGYLGYREETKKRGVKKVYTPYGWGGLIAGIASVLLPHSPYIAILLGSVAIVLGSAGLKRGDNTYASAGIISGIVGIVDAAIILVLFYFFNPSS